MQRRSGTRPGRRPQDVLLACALLLGGCNRTPAPGGAERLFDATRRDLGGIRVEADYSATYRITNSTSSPVSVIGVSTSCGCVVPDFDRSAIPPGGRRDIVLELSTHGQTVLGPLVKHAAVEFASGEKVNLTLEARLGSDFEVEPRRLEFSADRRTQKLSLTRRHLDAPAFSRLVLVAPSDRYRVVENASVTADCRNFEITMQEGSPGASLPEIYVADAPGGTPLPFSTVSCSRTGPTLRPSAFVVVLGDNASKPPAQRFDLIDFQSQPMKLTAVEGIDERSRRALSVSFDPSKDSKSFAVALTDSPSSAMTSLFIAATFEAVEGGVAGRLLLPCHVLTPATTKDSAH